jgi:DNA-binding Lrp family transcriptional regulator
VARPRLDELDRRIIEELQEDPRASYSTLGRKIGVDATTVRRRMEAMQEAQVLEFFLSTDPYAFGDTSHSLVELHTDPTAMAEVAAKCAELDSVIYVGVGTGQPLIWLSVVWASPEELYVLVSETLAQIPGVRDIRTHQIVKVLKRWPPWHWREIAVREAAGQPNSEHGA